MNYAGGEWTLLIVGAGLIVLGILTFVAEVKVDFDGDLLIVAIVLAIVGIVFCISSPIAAHSRADTLNAVHDVAHQGYTVLDMNLASKKATVQGPGGCVVHLDVTHFKALGYRVTKDGRLGDPNTLTCSG